MQEKPTVRVEQRYKTEKRRQEARVVWHIRQKDSRKGHRPVLWLSKFSGNVEHVAVVVDDIQRSVRCQKVDSPRGIPEEWSQRLTWQKLLASGDDGFDIVSLAHAVFDQGFSVIVKDKV